MSPTGTDSSRQPGGKAPRLALLLTRQKLISFWASNTSIRPEDTRG